MDETKVYAYTVHWQEKPYVFDDIWKTKTFACKKNAQKFARKYRDRKHKPYPYIVRRIVIREIFRQDVEVELAKDNAKRKLIRY